MVKVAINGFGRIGRAALKIALEHEDELEVVAVNDLGELNNLAYLLKYDSVYGRYGKTIEVQKGGLKIGEREIEVLSESEPENLPWQELEIDVVIESTGVFTDSEGAGKHLTAGAKEVVISAPTKSEDIVTVVKGVNEAEMSGQSIVSNASCTTNCAAPVVVVMDGAFGVSKACLTTVHAYTATQNLVDGPAKKDARRGRAAGVNMIPATTGAAVAATLAYPKLAGKFDGIALRVPVPVVSMSDLTMVLKKKVTVEEVNEALIDIASRKQYEGIIGVTNEPVVSSDFIGDPRSAIVDLQMTRVVDGDLVKVMAWYDNEWGYSNRLVEQVIGMGNR